MRNWGPTEARGRFVGIAAAVPTQHFTAVPVLARILGDLNIEHTRIGTLALASGAIGDGVVWVTVALVLIVVGTGGGPWEIPGPVNAPHATR
jgi:Kef-type K+ transport system membrane component KefB